MRSFVDLQLRSRTLSRRGSKIMRAKQCLTASDAQKIVKASKDFAQASGWRVSIAVVDDGGFLVHLERLDGAVLQSPELAILKARTAAICRCATRTLEEVAKERRAALT